MSASYYEIDPDTVASVGRQVFDLQPEADVAVNRLLSGYTDAAGVVHHPRVQQALGMFHDTHQQVIARFLGRLPISALAWQAAPRPWRTARTSPQPSRPAACPISRPC